MQSHISILFNFKASSWMKTVLQYIIFMRDARFQREDREEHKTDFVVAISRAKTNILNPNESNIPKTNKYSNIL